MNNSKTNNAVDGAVNWALDGDMREAVNGAVSRAVRWAVDEAVHGAVHGAVRWAVWWAVDEDSPHPGLQDFLNEIGEA